MNSKKTTRTLALFIVGIGLAVNGHAQSFLTNGLVAYFPFNGNANDASGSGHNGTVNGATLTTNRFGYANQAYRFDGSTAYITAPFSSVVFSNDFTVSAWFNPDDLANGWPTIVNEQNNGFQLGIAGDTCGCASPGQLYAYNFYPGPNFSWTLFEGGRPSTNTFSQVVVTKNANRVVMYLDGQVVVTNQVVNTRTELGQNLTIGRQGASGPAYTAFRGVIDDIRIYNRALPLNEVAQLFALESAPIVNIRKAVYVDSSNLWVGTNYQLQVSTDLNVWTNSGASFTATNSMWRSTNYWDVDSWNSLFFRLKTTP